MTPDKEATGAIPPTPLYCPTCKRTGRPLINTIFAATVGALRLPWLPADDMISNRQITPTAVGVIYLGSVTRPKTTQPPGCIKVLPQQTTTPCPQEATRTPNPNPGRHVRPPLGQLRTAQPSHVNQHRAHQYLYPQISAAPPKVSQNGLFIPTGEVEAEQQRFDARKGSPIDTRALL